MTKQLTLLCAILVLCFKNYSFSQSFSPIPLQEQLQNATLAIEGKVVNTSAFWNTTKTMIYTVYTVDVYNTFKGSTEHQIEVIEPGGTLGYDAIDASHSLHLELGTLGCFLLKNTSTVLDRKSTIGVQSYRLYSGLQGLYIYDTINDTASNNFNTWQGITQTFYKAVSAITKKNYAASSALKTAKLEFSAKQAIVPSNITFSPTTITAGTKSLLTINGSGFGNTRGTVAFKDADNGGSGFENALPSEIVSWNDTQIRVNVTANAGTGTIRITTANGASTESTNILTIPYSQINATSDGERFIIQHYDDNNQGGYTFELTPGLFNDTDQPGARAAFERALETWRCTTGVNWVISNQPSQENTREANGNVITFDGGTFELLSEGTNARTFTRRSGRNCPNGEQWFLTSIDILFNRDKNWYFGNGTIQNNQFDFESVALHELGHAHLLDHVIDPSNLMHFSRNAGTVSISRTIPQNIEDGANDVHQRSITNQICGSNPAIGLMTPFSGDCTLSTSNQTNPTFTVYPNPTKNAFFISTKTPLATNTKVRLYDLSGRLVLQTVLDISIEKQQIDIAHMASGMYTLVIGDGFYKNTQKLLLN